MEIWRDAVDFAFRMDDVLFGNKGHHIDERNAYSMTNRGCV